MRVARVSVATSPGAASLLLLLGLALACPAQRNPLGTRLKALESSWMSQEDPRARARALPLVEKAVTRFFTLRFASAGMALDEARFALAGAEVAPVDRFFASLRMETGTRIVAGPKEPFEVSVSSWYDAPPPTEDPGLLAVLTPPVGAARVEGAAVLRRDGECWKGRILVPEGTAGDFDLVLGHRAADRFVELERHAVAVVPGWRDRLEEARIRDEKAGGADDWRTRTHAALRSDLLGLGRGEEPEDEPRASALFAQLRSIEEGTSGVLEAPGDHRIAVPLGRNTIRARLAIPAACDERSPLLLLLHGAGGSENMFFEALGGGGYVRDGLQRGFVVCAPRCPLLGSLDVAAFLQELQKIRPFDSGRVVAVGHSMGAALALRTALRSPRLFSAMVLIAGAGPSRDLAAIRDLPILLGTGERDFGRAGVRSLHEALIREGAEAVRLVDLPRTEHLLVVSDLRPRVFDFLDERERGSR